MTRNLAERRPIVRLALSRTEVALAIGVSVGSVDQMVREGELPPPRVWHSRKLWIVTEIEAALNDWPTEDEAPRENSRWLDKLDQPSRGSGGYPIPKSKNDPIQQFFDKLGFDPQTMDQADMERLQAAAYVKWQADIPNKPIGARELAALKQFKPYSVGETVSSEAIKGSGVDTAQRLEARGFIEIVRRGLYDFDSFRLTEKGRLALKKIAPEV